MAGARGGGGVGQGDNSAGILWGVAAVFAAIGAIWYAFKSYIILFYLTIKLYEIDFLNLITNDYYANLHALLLTAIKNVHTKSFSFADIVTLGNLAGHIYHVFFAGILFVLAVVVYVGNSARIYRRIYSMRDLARAEKINWPQISPVVELDLLNTDLDTGPWAMAMQPMPFCKKHRLLQEVKQQRREDMSRKEWDKIEVILRRGDANRLFALQLGPLWRGTDNLPPYARGLFAVFAARINSDTKEAAKLIAQFNTSSTNKKIDMRGVNDLIKKHEKTPLVLKVTQSHAYVLTVMASMLERARDDGVQASADFLWLKPIDRRLWYTLNTVGRQTPFVEVAGVFSHWLAEKEAGRRLHVPMIEEATKALEAALKEILYRPDEA